MIKEKFAERFDITQDDILPGERTTMKVAYTVAAFVSLVISLISVIL